VDGGAARLRRGGGAERLGIDISVRRRCKHRRRGIQARSRPALSARNVLVHRDIPVTTPVQTLIDLATELRPIKMERAVSEADKLELVSPVRLRALIEDHPGEPGVRPLRALLDPKTFRLSDADLEILFRPLALAAGLPTPLTKHFVNDFEVDFYWPDLGLVIETDGLQYHRTPFAQTTDLKRDQTHTASGLHTLRFSHHQVKYEPAHVMKVLRDTAKHLPR
jgi:hypothetical protein